MSALPAGPVLRIRTHRAGAGLDWVRQGLRLYARQPLVLVVLVGLGPLFLGTLQIVPLVGDFAALVLTPAMALGMLTACRAASLGAVASVPCYVQALRDPIARLRLFQLGLVYTLFAAIVAFLFSLAPPADSATPGASSAPEFPLGPIPAPLVLALLVVAVPFAMMVWFAPALCGWYRMAVPKALFFSFFAFWRNRWAILVYLLTLLGLWVIAVMFVGALINMLNARQGLAPYLLVAPLLFLTLAISQCVHLQVVQAIIDDGA